MHTYAKRRHTAEDKAHGDNEDRYDDDDDAWEVVGRVEQDEGGREGEDTERGDRRDGRSENRICREINRLVSATNCTQQGGHGSAAGLIDDCSGATLHSRWKSFSSSRTSARDEGTMSPANGVVARSEQTLFDLKPAGLTHNHREK
jgi:hypothetical protein